jgi:hypothetical protein
MLVRRRQHRTVVGAIIALCEVGLATVTRAVTVGAKPMAAMERRRERRRTLALLLICLEPLVWISASSDWDVVSMGKDVDVGAMVARLQQWLREETRQGQGQQHACGQAGNGDDDDLDGDILRRLDEACIDVVVHSATNKRSGASGCPPIGRATAGAELQSSDIAALVALAMR